MTVFFSAERNGQLVPRAAKIVRLLSIVSETEQIAHRRNFRFKSRARISDGSGIRCFGAHKKIYADNSTRYHE